MTNEAASADHLLTTAKKIERAIADDLIRAIYKAEGWQLRDRAGFDSCVARCNALYTIMADVRRNRYVAVRLAPSAGIARLTL